jgi:signal transduction histidine kinase
MLLGKSILLFVYLLSMLTSLALINFYLLKAKQSKLLFSFIILQITSFIWSFGLVIEVISSEHVNGFIIVKFYYLGICFIGFAWLFLCLNFSESKFTDRYRNIFLLALPPAIFYIFLLTNEFHNLFYFIPPVGRRSFGPVFWLHSIISYLYTLSGTVALVRYSLKTSLIKRFQVLLLVFAAIIPLAFNFTFLYFKLGIEITPFSFVISSILFAVATFRYRFLNVISIALKNYTDDINEGIIVFDQGLRVINYNNAFYQYLLEKNINTNIENASDICEYLSKNTIKSDDLGILLDALSGKRPLPFSSEIVINDSRQSTYKVNINPVLDKKFQAVGMVATFTDVQDYKELLEELSCKNDELSYMNEQISIYAEQVEGMSKVKERERIARDVHDTLGHTMVSMISLTEALVIMMDEDLSASKKLAGDLVNISKDGLRELRQAVTGMTPISLESGNLIEALNELVKRFNPSGITIDLMIEGEQNQLDRDTSVALYKIIMEAITNSIKHGKASNIKLMIISGSEKAKLFIFDDGIGCHSIKNGTGLNSMAARVKQLNGSIVWGSDGETGFNLHIEIPKKETWK